MRFIYLFIIIFQCFPFTGGREGGAVFITIVRSAFPVGKGRSRQREIPPKGDPTNWNPVEQKKKRKKKENYLLQPGALR